MARDFRRPERRQSFLLPPDMQDWLGLSRSMLKIVRGVP
jgi:hypothetical protein